MSEPSEARASLDPPSRAHVFLRVGADSISILYARARSLGGQWTRHKIYTGSHQGSDAMEDLIAFAASILDMDEGEAAWLELTEPEK